MKKIVKRGISFFMSPRYFKKVERKLREKWQSFGLECSNICNANCSFCAYGKKAEKREKSFVSFETLKYALDLYNKAGGGDFVFGSIFGDPLTDKSFLDKVRIARQYPSVRGVSIYTNLIGLRNFNIDEFVASGITNMAISTCIGGRDVYRRLFGVDAYERVMEDLVSLLKANWAHGDPIDVKLLIRTDYDILKRLDSFKEYRAIKRHLNSRKIRLLGDDEWDNYNGVVTAGDLPKGARFKKGITDKSVPCYALYRKLQVLMNGDIAVCSCRISPGLVVDNIFNYKSLFDYWRGEKLNSFRERWFKGNIPAICRGCTHYVPYTDLLKGAVMLNIYSYLKKVKARFF